MKFSSLFLSCALVTSSLAFAGETVVLLSDETQNQHVVVLDEDDIDTFEEKTRDFQIESEFSTLGYFNRGGIKVTKEMLNDVIEVGADAGVHVMLGGSMAAAADVGLSTRVNLNRNADRTIFINGSVYHMFRGGYKGVDNKSFVNAGKIGLGRENNRNESYQLSLHFYKMAEDNQQADDDYLVIPMFTFGKKFR